MSENHSIIIKARQGSNRFKNFAYHMTVVDEVKDEFGQKTTSNKGEYKGERLPNTGGYRRPLFDSRKGRWSLIMDNGEQPSDELLNSLVSRCKFRYESGPNKGRLIETADIYDVDDEFFNHRQLKNYLDEGFAVLDADNPLHSIIAAGYRGMAEVAKVGQKQYTANQRLVISDGKAEEEDRSKHIGKKVEAAILFSKMTLDRKRRTLSVLKNKEYVVPLSEETINGELFQWIEDSEKLCWSGNTHIDEFIKTAKMSHEDLTIREFVLKAIRVGIIKVQRGGYLFDGKKIANTADECEYHFKQPDNLKDFEKLEKKLGIA